MISYLKKTVSVMLVLIALISCISIIPTAAVETSVAEVEAQAKGDDDIAQTEKSYEDFKYIVLDDGTIMITEYIGTSEEVTVPETIDDMDVSQIAFDAFDNMLYVQLYGYADSVAYYFAKERGLRFNILKYEYVEIQSFSATAVNKVKLKWEKTDNAQSYLVNYKRVDQNTDYRVTETKNNNIEIELDEDKTYNFYVVAKDSDGNMITEVPEEPDVYTCTTKVPITSLKNDTSGISIKWNAVTDAHYYRVYYKKNKASSWSKLCDTDKTECVHTSVAPGSSYTYTVRAMDENKIHISWYEWPGSTIVRIEQPKITSVNNQGAKAKITWKKVTGAASYKVYFRRSYNSTWKLLGTTTSTTMYDNNLASGITFYYTVEAVNSNKKYVSGKDNGEGGYEFFYLSVPKLSSARGNNKKGEIVVNWQKVTGANKYVLYYKRADLNQGWKRVGVTTNTSYTQKNCTSGKKYIYTVRCISDDGKKFTSYFDTKGISITYKYQSSVPELKKAVITSGNGKYAKAYITWGTVPGAYKYRIFYKRQAPDGTYSSSSWIRLATIDGTAYGDKKLLYGYKYIYTVRAVDKNGKYSSSFDSRGISITPTAANVKKSMGYLVKSNSVDLNYSAYPISLSSTDRYYAERIVMGESGNMSKEGMALVCQSLRDAYVYGGYSSIASTINSMGYVAPYKTPSQEVKDIVRYIFDEGGSAAEHRVLVFYACNICSSSWHESQCFIYQVGSVRYFDMWYF